MLIVISHSTISVAVKIITNAQLTIIICVKTYHFSTSWTRFNKIHPKLNNKLLSLKSCLPFDILKWFIAFFCVDDKSVNIWTCEQMFAFYLLDPIQLKMITMNVFCVYLSSSMKYNFFFFFWELSKNEHKFQFDGKHSDIRDIHSKFGTIFTFVSIVWLFLLLLLIVSLLFEETEKSLFRKMFSDFRFKFSSKLHGI